MSIIAIVLAALLWVAVAAFLLFMLACQDGMGNAFGYGTSRWDDKAAAILWPITLAALCIFALWMGVRHLWRSPK